MWGAASDERTGLSFIIAAGPRQHSHSRVQVREASDRILLSFTSLFVASYDSQGYGGGIRPRPPPNGISSTELGSKLIPLITPWHRPCWKHSFQLFLCSCVLIPCRGNLSICDRYLVTGLHATVYICLKKSCYMDYHILVRHSGMTYWLSAYSRSKLLEEHNSPGNGDFQVIKFWHTARRTSSDHIR
jgi:hypothetical protein